MLRTITAVIAGDNRASSWSVMNAPAKTVRRRKPPVAGGVRYPDGGGGGGGGAVNATECDFRWKEKSHQIKRVIIANYESPKVRSRRFNHFFFRGLRTDGVRTIYTAHACLPDFFDPDGWQNERWSIFTRENADPSVVFDTVSKRPKRRFAMPYDPPSA